jgi:GMP synthase (glutamine-hydrolysing)
MALLVFQHLSGEPLGHFRPVLESSRIPHTYINLSDDPSQDITREDFSGLILLGGHMSANDDFPYISKELAIIERAIHARLPVLGICLGAQLIARALGASVFRLPRKEIGWSPVRLTSQAASDPLLGLFQPVEPVFHWHKEAFDLPSGAAWLASSNACRYQAFRYSSNVYGLQFHLEVTPEIIARWIRQDESCGASREMTSPIDPNLHATRMRHLASGVFSAWLEMIRNPQ